jgi:hypothetical protein
MTFGTQDLASNMTAAALILILLSGSTLRVDDGRVCEGAELDERRRTEPR